MRANALEVVLEAAGAALRRAPVAPQSIVLVGLSGGADSVALLHALIELRERFEIRIAAAHLNHCLRGAESDRDEEFVRSLCARLGVELIVERATELRAGSANLEERAREIRHGFLGRAAHRLGAGWIAVGHHADDQAETVLIRLLRGAGAAGLSAMAEAGPGRLLRPLLAVSRAEILAYLRARGADFVEDSTNSSATILRNRIRHELIPMLDREYAPGIRRRLVELSGEMRSLDALAASLAARELDAMRASFGGLAVARFAGLHPAVQLAVIRAFLAERIGTLRRIERSHVEAIRRLMLEGGPNAQVVLPSGWRAVRAYDRVDVISVAGKAAPAPRFAVPLRLEGATFVEAARYSFHASTHAAGDVAMPADLSQALFDAARIGDRELTVRNFIRGDRISPLGMRGARKVKDVFIDRKLPPQRRGNFPIVALGDEIVWLPGLVRARSALVTKATETVLRVDACQMAF